MMSNFNIIIDERTVITLKVSGDASLNLIWNQWIGSNLQEYELSSATTRTNLTTW